MLFAAADPSFEAIRGEGGDQGADGFAANRTVLVQMYGPDRLDACKVRKKIDDSLAKAVTLRATVQSLRVLRFVTPQELTTPLNTHLHEAARGCGFVAEPLGDDRLLAMLACHPKVAEVFPETLMPSILDAIQNLHAVLTQVSDPFDDDVDAIGQSRTFPHVDVMQPDERPDHPPHGAYENWRVWVHSPALAMESIEPNDEDAYLETIRDRFVEDRLAEIEDRTDNMVRIHHAGHELEFHRRWTRWAHGTIAMAASIRDWREGRRGEYRLAEIAIDLTRFLRLAAELIPERGCMRIRFALNPGKLRLCPNEPADLQVRDRFNAELRGVTNPLRPILDQQPSDRVYDGEASTDDLLVRPHELAASYLAPTMKHFHKARVDTRALSDSIPPLIDANLRARRL